MARIVWTREALASPELIRSYIHQFDPQAAHRMALRLIEAGDSLRTFPDRGRPVSGGRRELVTIPPYIIRYKFDGERVFIVGVRHSAQLSD
ncbi:MAG: type toxin-antitoxin system RelE/ParE family toxin [Sphingomonas bacterium]|uniref:type II toxin-antitoxin system RelE/ParE family toxin n=1 Tax=Sphingomonas bacterium TaxID=1895847 RepID=UPI0026110E76|nr:type II toxin-antitoxin system RelE/ParE family toxin [Sphingomonas bacterium]MDB5705708.1 type toxin-antitoxin system RelE/ParE family toxin [Sphingomonas bacterium]